MNNARSAGGLSLNPLSWADISGFVLLQHIRPKAWELAAIQKMDAAYLQTVHEISKAGGKKMVEATPQNLGAAFRNLARKKGGKRG